jgi:hypothetical protein
MPVQPPSQVQLFIFINFYMYNSSYFYSTACFGLTPSSGRQQKKVGTQTLTGIEWKKQEIN